MLELNLFHEQQQLQRERDRDPVRLTILGGILLASLILLWAFAIYLKAGPLRTDLEHRRTELDKLSQEFTKLGPVTDLPKIQQQAEAIQERVEYRALISNQLDVLREIIPTNCQIRVFRTVRSMAHSETIVPSKRDPKTTISIHKVCPAVDMIFEIDTRAKDKVEVLQIRDNLIETFRREIRFQSWIKQVNDGSGSSNFWNAVTIVTSTTQDPKAGQPAIGIFEFKLPFALKDQPREL